MSRKTWVVLVIVLCALCVIGSLCAVAGYFGYRYIQSRGDLSSGGNGGTALTTGAVAGTLRLGGGQPPTLDPAMIQDSTSAEYAVHLFSGLVSLNSRLEIVPDLASRWDISEDGRTYTFHLLPDATFADGKAITAQDFVYSIERACSPKLESPVAASYLDDIVGATDMMAGRAEHIKGLQVLDDHTLQIEIDAPKAFFLAKLTYSTAFVVDKQQIEAQGDSWLRKPNGSGPFVLESQSADRIVLTRNEHFYGKRPALQRVEFLLNGGSPMTMYENNEIDIVDVSTADIERVLDPANPLYAEHHVASELSVQYLALNVNMPPFDDLAVRQAFACAIDKRKIAELVLKSMATPAKGIMPPSLPDYDATFEGLPYDPARARQLLASSRYAAPGAMPKIVLTTSGVSGYLSPIERAILSMLQQNLGIEVTVEQVDWGFFLRDMNAQRYAFYSSGWIGDYPDAQDFLDILFHSASPQNHTGYHNAQVDTLLEQARVERDATKRTTLYRQAERTIISDAAWIPLTHGVTYTLVKPYVKGFETSAAIFPWLKDIVVEK
jgi:oligopeptide transport system substrate-binding protein